MCVDERSYVTQGVTSPFGERDWNDVRRMVARRLRRRFPRLGSDIMEDVMGEVMVDLVGYWQGLTSSLSEDTEQNFTYAVMRGTWRGVEEVGKFFGRRDHEVPFSAFTVEDDDDGHTEGYYIEQVPDPNPGPDELVCEADLSERAREVLADLPETELRDWFENLLSTEGVTEREAARRAGVSQTTYRERRARRLRNARAHAVKYGLV